MNNEKCFSDVRGIDFGLNKYAEVTFQKGIITETYSIDLDFCIKIRELVQEEAYKYLAIIEGDVIQHSQMKEKLRKKYYKRVCLVGNTERNSKTKYNL